MLGIGRGKTLAPPGIWLHQELLHQELLHQELLHQALAEPLAFRRVRYAEPLAFRRVSCNS